MKKPMKIALLVVAALLLQVTLLPAYIADPFQPDLLIILVVYLGLKSHHRLAPLAAFGLGLLQDVFSGIYFGLSGFSFLCIFLVLSRLSDRLYTDNRLLLVMVVFLATVAGALIDLVLLFIFSVAGGIYSSILAAVLPQALVNAFVASLLLNLPLRPAEEAP